MELLQNVGHAYLEKKAFAAPQMLEDIAKKQFSKPRKSGKKQQSSKKFVSPAVGEEEDEIVAHTEKKHSASKADSKAAEIANVRSQLDHFSFDHGENTSQLGRKPSKHSSPSEAASHRSRNVRLSRSEERAPSVATIREIHPPSRAHTVLVSEHSHSHAASKISHSHAPSHAAPHSGSLHKSAAPSNASVANTLRGRIPSTANEVIEVSIAASEHGSHHVPSHSPSVASSHRTSHTRARSAHESEHRRSHAPSHAASHHTLQSRRRSSHEDIVIGSGLVHSYAPSHAPSRAPSHRSHHTSHTAARSSHAGTIKAGSEHDRSHAPSHVASHAPSHAPSHHTHHTSHSRSTAKPSSHHAHSIRDDVSIYPESSISCRDDSDDDVQSHHGGSAALLHQRQKYRRRCSLGVVPELPPLESRDEIVGGGFKPHRAEYAEVFEEDDSRMILAPHVKEIRRHERQWDDHKSVVEISREENGRRLYKVR